MTEKVPVMLSILAHPDDETFGMGGTLAYYARRGVKVYLICATRGEVGDVEEKYMAGYNSIAERRESELRCAAGLLGLSGVIFLGYRDSGMPGSADNDHPNALAAQPEDKLAREVAHYIRKIEPDVVITFDPIGGYRHPDHIAIHKATRDAFRLAYDPTFVDPEGLEQFQSAKLYYQTIPRWLLRMAVRWYRLIGKDPHKFGHNQDIDLASIAEVDFPINAVVNYRQVADIRDKAAACHASQGGGMIGGGILAPIRRLFSARELFIRAYPEANGVVENDLFAGLTQLPPLVR